MEVHDLDDGHPRWLVNEQIKGLLEGDGAGEDHEDVVKFLCSTGLPSGTANRMHRAIVGAEAARATAPEPVISVEHGPWAPSTYKGEEGETYCTRCYLRDKFLGSRDCTPHLVHQKAGPQSTNEGPPGAAREQPKRCEPCRSTGLTHCAHPDECGGPWTQQKED